MRERIWSIPVKRKNGEIAFTIGAFPTREQARRAVPEERKHMQEKAGEFAIGLRVVQPRKSDSDYE